MVAGTDGRTLEHILCYNCDHHGHYAGQCPDPDRRVNGANSVQIDIVMSQNDNRDNDEVFSSFVINRN